MSAALAIGALAFAPALAVGSFLNVVASRLPAALPIGTSRSACMSCDAEIRWYDNVPLFSYVVLRGRCRDCGASIPARYPIVEGATAVLGAAAFVRFGVSGYALLAAVFCALLVVLSAIDIEHRIVPNKLVVPAAAVVLAAHTALAPSIEWVSAALAAATFLLLAALAYPRGMGMGDVKLALLLGAMLGRSVVVALMVGMVAALLPALVVALRRETVRGLAVPFVPFLAFGSVVALFWGDAILDAYLSITT